MSSTPIRVIICLLMLAADVAWLVLVFRLAKSVWLRALLGLFLLFQTGAMISFIWGKGWVGDAPKPVFVSLILWHYFAFVSVISIASFLLCRWIVRGVSRKLGLRRKETEAAKETAVPGARALNRREFLGNCAAVAPMALNFGLTGFAMAQLTQFRIRPLTLPIAGLPRDLDGLTIAHVSDMHVGPMTSGDVLRKMVEATNSLRADLILLTGDLIHYNISDLPEALRIVNAMESRYGKCMIEGNHDLFQNAAEFGRQVRAAGVPYLVNETSGITARGCPIQFYGLPWLQVRERERNEVTKVQLAGLMKQRDPDAFQILLAHHPHAFDMAAQAGIPLTLSGHTHGGQWMLSEHMGIGPAFFRYWSGLYTLGSSKLVVSNGVGNVFPIRVNVPAEIVHIKLARV